MNTPEMEEDRDPVEELAAEFIDRFRDGERPTIDSYVKEYPEHADGIRGLFPTILALENMKRQEEKSAVQSASSLPLKLQELGDFKIVHEIGRGGMGIVYEAQQESLGRRVALKVLPKQALLDAEQLGRFQQEARIAARLHHTNLVSLHGVGEQDGYHFLVMELIEGASLDKVIPQVSAILNPEDAEVAANAGVVLSVAEQAELNKAIDLAEQLLRSPENSKKRGGNERLPPTNAKLVPKKKRDYFRNIALIGRDAASALQYAYDHGVVHRDIKPANLILDSNQNILISDFGLARRLADGSVTNTVYGTLAYMPPEGFEGKLDERSDVYSLGLTLYEALTLQKAFGDVVPADAVKRLADASFRFKRPREIDPTIPKDLETIVLKAAARDPRKRYGMASEMADDLQLFLDNRPVKARRTSAIEHAWRWCERNKAIASLVALAVSLLALVAIVMTANFFIVRQANLDAQASLKLESDLRERSEDSLKVATSVLEEIYNQIVPIDLASHDQADFTHSDVNAEANQDERASAEKAVPTLSPDMALLLENLLKFYDRLSEQSDGNPELQETSTKSISRIADIYRQLGQREKSLEYYNTALKRLDALQIKHQRYTGFFVESARIHNQIGYMEFNDEQYNRAKNKFHSALAILIQGKTDGDPLAKYEEAKSHYYLGCRKPSSASKVATQQLSMRPRPPKQSGAESPKGAGSNGPPGRPPRRGARARETDNDDEHRLGHLEKAIEILNSQPDEFRQSPNFKLLTACCYREMGGGFDKQLAMPISYRSMAIEILEKLVEQFPSNPHYRLELVEALRSDNRPGEDSHPKSIKSMKVALENVDLLVSQHPQVPHYAMARMHVLHKMGHTLNRQSRFANMEDEMLLLMEAESMISMAQNQIYALREQWPKVTEYQLWAVVVDGSLAKIEFKIGDLEKSRITLAAAIEALTLVSNENVFDAKLQAHLQTLRRSMWQIAKGIGADDLVELIESCLEWKLDPESSDASRN